MNIKERVAKIIVDQLGVKPEQVTPDADIIDDLGADSLDTVELVIQFEDEFRLDISDQDAERMKKVKDIIQYFEERAISS